MKNDICKVESCSKKSRLKGLCNAHYLRLQRHGSPTGGGPPKGYGKKWLHDVALGYQGDDCLVYPFYRGKSGHARIGGRGHTSFAHRYLLEIKEGPAPSDNHEACHACGCGHKGCVNPNHLYWGTRAQNVADRKEHGCFVPPPVLRGEKNNKAKIVAADVLDIRERASRGESVASIKDSYTLGLTSVYNIIRGKTWAHVQ